MSFNKCVLSLRLQKKLPIADLRADAQVYEAQGMDPEAALLQVIDDRLALARIEEASILRQIEAAHAAATGATPEAAKPAPAPAPEPINEQPAPAAAPSPEPQARSEEAEVVAAPAEPEQDDGADIPLAFYKKVKVPHEVHIEDIGGTETIEVPADQALASVREDIANLQALLKCMKGGA